MKKRWIAALAATCVVGGWVAADAISRQFMSAKPAFHVEHAAGSQTHTAVVYFAGAYNNGEIHTRQLRPLFLQRGMDSVTVLDATDRFDAPLKITATHAFLVNHGYTQVLLVGASIGGAQVAQLIDYNLAHGEPYKVVGVILADPLMDKADLIPRSFGIEHACWAGWPSNLLGPVFFSFFPTAKPGEPGTDLALLREDDAAGHHWKLSSFWDQQRYIDSLPYIPPGHFHGIPAVILRSTLDDAVMQTATEKWQAAFAWQARVQYVKSTHVGFTAFPHGWHDAFEGALDYINIFR